MKAVCSLFFFVSGIFLVLFGLHAANVADLTWTRLYMGHLPGTGVWKMAGGMAACSVGFVLRFL